MKAQEELKNEVVEASAGGGMVTVKVTGDLELREVTIDPEAVDPEDVEMLQDTVLAAVNEALRSAQELASAKLGGIAGGLGGLGLPGL
jgi:nucleoid-associated protein EbfC